MRVRIAAFLLAATAFAAAAPVEAQSPAASTTNADGTYVGVSSQNTSSGNTLGGGRARTQGHAGARACPNFRAPAKLTIINGRARVRWGDRTLEGDTLPDGSLTMTTGYGQKFDGRIDAEQITGQLVGYCAYNLTWRKQSKS
jgi:hypothetical protein